MGLPERFARISAGTGLAALLAAVIAVALGYAALVPFFVLAAGGLFADAFLPPEDVYGVTDVGIVLKLAGAGLSALLLESLVSPAATVLHSGGFAFAYQFWRGPRYSLALARLGSEGE